MSDQRTEGEARRARGWLDSLSVRLFGATLFGILLIEALVFIPSASNFRTMWLKERVQAARIAALALDAAPTRNVSDELASSLLTNAEVLAVAEIEDEMHVQLLAPAAPIEGDMFMVQLYDSTAMGRSFTALGSFFAPKSRVLVILDEGSAPGRMIEVVVPQAPLKAAMQGFATRVAGLSLLIGLVAASFIYYLLHALVVRPMQRVTGSVVQFKSDPGGWKQRLAPTRRRDEIGEAQNALADMEIAVAESFRQRAHLAELGSAVAKINHDLRNSLTSAQLVSDTLERSDDPRVRRAAPRLERALRRAIQLAEDTLAYGKAKPQKARMSRVLLLPILQEAAEEALVNESSVALDFAIAPETAVYADPDFLHRIASNLIRNAAGAIVASGRAGRIRLSFSDGALDFLDDGPGLPDAVRVNLFKPFATSTREGGTGLGLAIARELAEAMGGALELAETGASGTRFRLVFGAPA